MQIARVGRLNPGVTPAVYEVYPKYYLRVDVPPAQTQDARTRYSTYLEDIRVRTRDLIRNSLGGTTTILDIYRITEDGRSEMMGPDD